MAENYKMASSLVDVASFPPEIISKIAQFLPLQDVLKCMLVCKSWKVSNSIIIMDYVSLEATLILDILM